MMEKSEWDEVLMNDNDEPDEVMNRDGSLEYIGDYECLDYDCNWCEHHHKCKRRGD